MSFVEHLGEMRSRILWSLFWWAACSVAAWFLTPYIIAAVRRLIGDTQLVFLRPTEAFMVYVKIALLAGLFLSLPIILYQIAAFVMPGLEANEKKWVKRVIPAAFLLFIAGGAFAYFVMLPTALGFFLGFQQQFQDTHVTSMLSVEELMGFVMLLIVVCGLMFQIPIVVTLLALVGVVGSPLLRKGRRWAILLIFIIAGVATPTPDAFTQCIVAIPMLLLYEISILIVRAMGK